MSDTALGWWGVPLALFAGAIRSSTPFLFVSLGELITEKSGRINLGQEGILILGAMCSYGVAFLTGSPWLGVLMAGCAGAMPTTEGLEAFLAAHPGPTDPLKG